MSGYKGHLLGGFVSFLITYYVLTEVFKQELSMVLIGLGLLVSLWYSIFPDIDIDTSKSNNFVEKLFLGFILLLIIVLIVVDSFKVNLMDLIGFSLPLPPLWIVGLLVLVLFWLKFIPHRTVIHTPTAGLVFSVPLCFVSCELSFFGFVAYMSHLILDGEVFR